MDFDETRLYYSHQDLQIDNEDDHDETRQGNRPVDDDDDGNVDLQAVRRHFREFLRNYRLGSHRYLYREKLLRMHRRLSRSPAEATHAPAEVETAGGADAEANNATYGSSSSKNANLAKLEVDLAHVGEYHASLLGYILHQPATMLPCLEQAATDALETLLYDAAGIATATTGANKSTTAGPIPVTIMGLNIQVLLVGNLQPTALRSIKSEHMNRLLKCPGIIISSSPVKNRAVQMTVRCFRCLDTRTVMGSNEGPFASVSLPSTCQGPDPQSCGRYPYAVVPDESRFVDQQTLKLQEAPEKVPTGEMPRSVLLSVERSLVDAAPPGTRVHVMCIPTLLTSSAPSAKGRSNEARSVYLRVVGLVRDSNGSQGGQSVTFTPAEEEAFQTLARHPQVYSILSRSIAPNISGSYTVDIKKSLACQLFGGSRKKLPDGLRLRGDINVLLLGDPSMAKSQFLKFVSKVAPVGIYTSGKGSSAAGLTASVVRDAKGEFYLEGGAMVLADGGIVCIDEFDKMRPNDRVAIHEAMEQQTISIAKAGITTVLNSRSSVLAAANPVYGRYDDYRSASENIDLMATILSRFDLIFLVRDVREEERDRMICQHVMGVHIQSSRSADGGLGHNQAVSGHSRHAGAEASALSYRTAASGPDESQDPSHGAASMTPEAIAENVLRVASSGQGELDVLAMKKYVQYAKARCSPRLSDDAGQVLASSYVKIRDQVRRNAIDAAGDSEGSSDGGAPAAIPITVRQLEALVRLSESLAKMRLDSEVRPEDVTEALRLFQVSTMAANAADQVTERSLLSSSAGSGSSSSQRDELDRTESFLRSRLQLGSLVNKQKLIEEAAGTGYNALIVTRALAIMASRGEILERNQGRLIKRIK